MSKFNLYSIYDRAAETFNTPLAFISDAVAIRTLRETLRDPSTIMARYPDDYQLVKVAEFFVENGEVAKCHVILLDSFVDLVSAGVELSGGGSPQEVAVAAVSGSTSNRAERDHERADLSKQPAPFQDKNKETI